MKDFVETLLKNSNFYSVKSYIQSGNLVVKSKLKTNTEINNLISKIILKEYQYDILTFAYTLNEFKNIYADYPYLIDYKTNYLTFLAETPNTNKTIELKNKIFYTDEFKIYKKVIHIKYATKYSNSKLNNNYFEQQLSISATTRNIKTVSKLIEIAEK